MVMALLARDDERAVNACLDGASVTGENLCSIINGPTGKGHLIGLIAEHQKWSLRYDVRYGLIRNFYTPMRCAAKFIEGMKTSDLRDLYRDTKVPLSTKPLILRELLERDKSVAERLPEAYGLPEEENLSPVDAGPM